VLPFKKGAFFLAAETGAPMVPIVIRGTAQMMRKGSLKVYPEAVVPAGEVTVEFLAPLHPQDYADKEDLMAAVRTRMEEALAQGTSTAA
jgi:1-acyl-sn-glycerol-3-phosphate acyltransferase